MLDIKNEKLAIPVVVFAGLLWSFGPLVVRNMDDPGLVLWQYLFARGLVIFFLLNIYLFFDEGIEFYKNYLRKNFYLPPKVLKHSINSPFLKVDLPLPNKAHAFASVNDLILKDS